MKSKKKLLSIVTSLALLTISGNAYTFGAEAVNKYNGTNPDLTDAVALAKNFNDAIDDNKVYCSGSWNKEFGYWDNSAWEEDYKQPSAGTDTSYADKVDLTLFSGHGDVNGFYFGTSHDDLQVNSSDAVWGDYNNEWMILDACQVLKLDNGKIWNNDRFGRASIYAGIHQVIGWDSNANDTDTRGKLFIEYAMADQETILYAWYKATKESSNNRRAAIIYKGNTKYDHLHGCGTVANDPSSGATRYHISWGT